jgi:hypothetical protein
MTPPIETNETFNRRTARLHAQGHRLCACLHAGAFHTAQGVCGFCECEQFGEWEVEGE